MRLWFNILIASFSSLGVLLLGYDFGVIAPVVDLAKYRARFGTTDSSQAAVVSVSNGGCFFGALIAGWANGRFGRRRTMQLGALVTCWGSAMQCGSGNVATLLIGRIVGGVGIGILSVTVPLYNTEVAPPKIRGFLVGLTNQMIGTGLVVAQWVSYGSRFIGTEAQWRLPLGVPLIPAFLLMVGMEFLPESPRWLLQCGKEEDARRVVFWLHGESYKEAAKAEYNAMYEAIRAATPGRWAGFKDLRGTSAMKRRTAVAISAQAFNASSGVKVVGYFAPAMYQRLALHGHKLLVIQAITVAIGPIANLLCIVLAIDRVGRRKPMLVGTFGFAVLFSVLAAIVATNPGQDPTSSAAAQRAGIAIILLMIFTFNVTMGPVSWVMAPEVFPTNTRAIGTGVATAAYWTIDTLIGQVAPIGLGRVGWKFYIPALIGNFMNGISAIKDIPETKGRPLEEMHEVFGDELERKREHEVREEVWGVARPSVQVVAYEMTSIHLKEDEESK